MSGPIVVSVMSIDFKHGARQNLDIYVRNFLLVVVGIAAEVLCSVRC